jgi:hypothetical protein
MFITKPLQHKKGFNASELTFPTGLFDGPPERKTLKLRQGQTFDSEQLLLLVSQAVATL